MFGALVALGAPGQALAADPTPAPTPLASIAPAPLTAAGPVIATGDWIQPARLSPAKLTGTVAPGTYPVEWRFEIGEDDAFSLKLGWGKLDPGAVPQAVSSLTTSPRPGRTFRYRLAVRLPGGEVRYGDVKTAHTPYKALARSNRVTETTPDGATLTGSVHPHGLPTRYWFEYGETKSLGTSTPPADAGAGIDLTPVSGSAQGLKPSTRYYVRLVAENSEGRRRSGLRSFKTLRGLSRVSLFPSSSYSTWGRRLAVGGDVSGSSRVAAVKVTLQRQDWPFDGGWRTVGRTETNIAGAYGFTVGPLWSAARLRVVVSDGPRSFTSPVRSIQARVYSRLRVRNAKSKTMDLSGSVYPATADAQAYVQRRTGSGRWLTVERPELRMDGKRGRFRVTVKRYRSTKSYRMVVIPKDAGRHTRTLSSSVKVRARRR